MTWKHPVGPDVTALLVMTHANGPTDANRPVTGATAGGNAMTQGVIANSDSLDLTTEIWYVPNPAEGNVEISVDIAGSVTGWTAHAVSLRGVDPTDIVDSTGTTSGNGTTATASITTVADRAMILDALWSEDDYEDVSPAADQFIARTDPQFLGGDAANVSFRIQPAAGATSAEWSWNTASDYVLAAMSVTPGAAVAGGGGGGGVFASRIFGSVVS
jgi:hypothetical protein